MTASFVPPLAGQIPSLVTKAIAGVLRHAQEGELPLFAWTLGLPQPALLDMLASCFPELEPLEAMPPPHYQALLDTAPDDFAALVELLRANQTPNAEARQADWLARAIAAASFGGRHLWADLALSDRDEVSALMAHYFQPLFARNTRNIKWKRFIFAELGKRQGRDGLRPPGCSHCDQFQTCFPG